MRAFLISDNIDTLMGFRLVGVEGVVVHSENELRNALSSIVCKKGIALVMITERLVEICHDYIFNLKFSGRTQIVQIPDRHGSKKTMRETINGYLKSALGLGVS